MSRRVLVVYHHLPHYRFAVFKAMESTPGYTFHFAGAVASRDGSIPVLGGENLTSVRTVRNHWIGPFLWQSGLFRLLREPWDNVVFLGDAAFLSTWLGAAYMRVRRVPVGFWTIGWHRPESGLRKWYRRWFYQLANRLYLYGDVGRGICADMGYPDEKMGVIYNSSGGPDDYAEVETPMRPASSPLTIGAVIRLNKVKRLDLLIRAASIVRRRGVDLTVEILGEGPERNNLEELADELEVPLILPGAVYESATIRRFYDRLSVTVVPSHAGLSVTQSMRCGRPVITHDHMNEQMPECEAIVENVTGSLYQYGNVEHLADAITNWLDRQAREWEVTTVACHEEISRRWTGKRHAQAIIKELQGTHSRRRKSGRTLAVLSRPNRDADGASEDG